MSNASNWLEEAILNHFFRNSAIISPTQVYIALYKTSPTDFDTGIEISGEGYVRQEINFTTPSQESGIGTITNTTLIAFPEAISDWTEADESVGFWGIRNSLTAGDLLAYGEFKDTTKPNDGKYPVLSGDQFNIGAGKLKINIDLNSSYWLQNAVLNHFFRNAPTTSPALIYLALYKSDPTGADTGIEITYSTYERQTVSFSTVTQDAESARITNVNEINFPIPDVDLGTVPFFGLRDNLTSGNLLAHAPWNVVKNISAGMQFSVTSGSIEVTLS